MKFKCKACGFIGNQQEMDDHNNTHNKTKSKEGWTWKCKCENCRGSSDKVDTLFKCLICNDNVWRYAECDTEHFYEKHTILLEE